MNERTYETVIESLTEKIDLLKYQLKCETEEKTRLKADRDALLEERNMLLSRVEKLELSKLM